MWYKVAYFTSYLLGTILVVFLLLILASRLWRKFKRDREYIHSICRVVGASQKLIGAVGEFKSTKYSFFYSNFRHNQLNLKIKAKSPIKLVIIKKGSKSGIITMLKRVVIDDNELSSEYLIYSSNVDMAREWLEDESIKDELIGIINSGCCKLKIKQNSYSIYWRNLSQLELKYLPEWVGETIDRAVALKYMLLKYIKKENITINPPVWRYFIILLISLITFIIIYNMITPLDILYTIFLSMLIALPFIFFYVYKAVSFSFQAKKSCLAISVIYLTLSLTLFTSSVILVLNRVFVESEPKYIKVNSLESIPFFGDVCLELIELRNQKSLLIPSPVCSENRNNLDVKVYNGRFNLSWVDIDRVATKLSLVDVYSAFEAGDATQAITLANKYIDLNPKDIYGYYARGKIYFSIHKYNRALMDMESILSINQHQLSAYSMIDKILSMRGEWKKITLLWTQLIKLEPRNAKAHYKRAEVYLKIGEKDRAKDDFERACGFGISKACKRYKQLK